MRVLPRIAHVARVKLAARAAAVGAVALTLIVLAQATACAQEAAPAPTVQLTAGIHLIHAEVADDEYLRERGLMYRTSLAPNHGMLFVFDSADTYCMWMRNTLIALSVAFLDDEGTVVNIEEMKPQTEQSHCARRPVRYALEMSGQWFSRHGVQPGSRLQGLGGKR